mmetsp:Transcript_4622/g.7554  ORF Transcript_4622/g.7554 Transcript_4622/m.7554 type:complete len:291 (+) Transcript_4622:180-1052(+)
MTKKEQAYEVPPPSIYFGGCAFGSAFYVGVFKGMRERWGPDFHKKILISGGSAGTIFAICIALGYSDKYMDEFYSNVAVETLKRNPIYYGSYYLEQELRKMLQDPLAYKKLEGRCCFGTTAFFSKHRWHVSWESNEDLIACVQGSYHIPLYCKKAQGIKGVAVLDGAYGFSGENLPHGDATLYVGIDPHAEITRTLTNPEMFYPCVGEEYDAMVKSGYDAMMNWDGKMNKKVENRIPNYPALYVLWYLKVLESLLYGGLYICSNTLFLLASLLAVILFVISAMIQSKVVL